MDLGEGVYVCWGGAQNIFLLAIYPLLQLCCFHSPQPNPKADFGWMIFQWGFYTFLSSAGVGHQCMTFAFA